MTWGPAGSIGALAAAALLTAACGDEGDVPHVGHAPQQIRPTDGSGWNGNGYGSVTVKSWDTPSGKFRVHYTLEGNNAVPAADSDSDGTPDFVEEFGKVFDEVYKEEVQTLGFRSPLDDALYHDRPDYGGDGRFDVYLQDQSGADGYYVREACQSGQPPRCAGYMVVENDFTEFSYPTPKDGMKVLASHEFFHAVQNAYRAGLPGTFSEATAVWATEQTYPAQNDFESFIRHFFKTPERSLDHILGGPVDLFPYGLAIWPTFLAERFGAKLLPAVMDELSEKGQSSDPLDAVDRVLARDQQSSLSAAYAEFALWNLLTGKRAGSGAAGYKAAAGFPEVPVATGTQALPLRISGEIAYLGARYYRVQAPAGRWVQVTSEYPQTRLALHLVTYDSPGGKARVVSAAAGAQAPVIRSGGELLIVAASTARSDRHLPLSLAVTEVAAPPPDGGLPAPDGGTGADPGASGGCSLGGTRGSPGGVPWPLAALALLALAARRRAARPR
jgi:hypothetical protein